MTLVCEHCGAPIVQGVGRTPRYCSGAHRVAAHRARQREQLAAAGVPVELRRMRRWTRWSRIRRGTAVTKLPLTVDGRAASSTDPSTWATWDRAQRSRFGTGLGFVLAGDGVLAFDLDECVDEHGAVSAPAQDLLRTLPRTWVELSPSGRGLHVWGYGTVGKGRRFVTAGGLRVELYDRGRFVTVSGRPVVLAPLADVGQALALLELDAADSLGGWKARESA
ncbi:MAG: DNA primase [Propionibacteriaceae bacterium]|nr:MAG: DNA primase [Propionibacteriaceae bacterium]